MFGVLSWGCAAALLILRAPITYAGPGNDFWNYFYPAGKEVLNGYLHYATPVRYTTANTGIFRYPPFAALLFAAFAWLPRRTADIAFWAFNVSTVIAVGVLLASRFGASWATRLAITGMLLLGLLSFAPLESALAVQIDPFILLLLVGAYCAIEASSDRARGAMIGGFLLGLAIAIKVYPVVPLVVLLWLRREYVRQILAGTVAALLLTTALTIPVVGVAPFWHYFHAAGTQSNTVLSSFFTTFGVLNVATRLLTPNPYTIGSLDLSASVPRIVYAVFAVGVFVALAWRYRNERATPAAAWITALGAAIICSPFLEVYHLTTLAVVPVLLAIDATQASDRPARGGTSTRGTGGLVVLVASCVVCSFVVPQIGHHVGEALSAAVALAVGAILWRAAQGTAGPRIVWAASGACFVFLSTPSFDGLSGFWGFPMSMTQAVVGSGELMAAVALVACIVWLNGRVPDGAASGRPEPERAAVAVPA